MTSPAAVLASADINSSLKVVNMCHLRELQKAGHTKHQNIFY